MSWDLDKDEFFETFEEISQDQGLDEAKRWAWEIINYLQKDSRKSEK